MTKFHKFEGKTKLNGAKLFMNKTCASQTPKDWKKQEVCVYNDWDECKNGCGAI